MAPETDFVSFDLRRNLISVLGDDHYPFAEYVYHELAANSYDEDATRVEIVERVVEPARRGQPAVYDIVVTDDGNGMDRAGLSEWFRVGESGKVARASSERLHRPLIGRIGVGKVSILKVARRWSITTERHLGVQRPVRFEVDVDIEAWIEGRVDAFAVTERSATGRAGTTIRLADVATRLREDRILRMLQRLPLGSDFLVWRNGKLIPPRQWSGIDMLPIDETITWNEGGSIRDGRIRGEIWIRPEVRNRRGQAFIEEPKLEQDALNRDPAGIEVRVNGDVIVREFFGHETYGHGVNRIWGWVDADFLPILGNRTDYVHDSPAGSVFFEIMRARFADAFGRIRYENEARAQERRTKAAASQSGGSRSGGEDRDQEGEEADREESDAQPAGEQDELLASRYAEAINRILADKPELGVVLDAEAERSRGRPAKDRIYPVRPSGELVSFEMNPYGSDLGLVGEQLSVHAQRPRTGSILRASSGGDVNEEPEVGIVERGERVVNTTAGIRLRFVALGGFEAPYRWALSDPRDLSLDINTDHKVYRLAGRPGGALHRLHCAWLVALAIAERNQPTAGRPIADYIETLSYELIAAWAVPRRSG